MSIDLTQQALNALADAGLGNDTPAEAYVIGYTQGHNDALALARYSRQCPDKTRAKNDVGKEQSLRHQLQLAHVAHCIFELH